MRIAFITIKELNAGGGVEKYTSEVGERLASRGHNVVVYTMRRHGGTNRRERGMEIRAVSCVRTKGFEKLSATLAASILEARSPERAIVHYHAFGPGCLCFMQPSTRKRTVVQGHGIEWRRSRWGTFARLGLQWLEKPSILLPDELTVVSKVQQEYVKQRYARESVYIPTGVNMPAPSSAQESLAQYGLGAGEYILFAARLVPEKGAHHLISGFKRANTDKRLVIAGGGTQEHAYVTELERLAGGDRRIAFLGHVTGVALDELFANCALFVLPSDVEGLPMALLEALAHGCRCLASDIPENREALSGWGFTFRQGDVADLARRLSELLALPLDLRQQRDTADAVYTSHNWTSVVDRLEILYRRLWRGAGWDNEPLAKDLQ
jgi:glycosyltransferase involved in cell wall biosynthesis